MKDLSLHQAAQRLGLSRPELIKRMKAAGLLDSSNFQPNLQHTPKARIPHERLRRGAKHIATLRLMTRSPAQLVEGGKRPPKPTDNALIRTLCAQIREQNQEIAALRIANTDLLQRLEKAEGGRA